MFSDPISVSIGDTPQPLPRISTGDMQSRYRNADGTFELAISHQGNKRERTMVKLTSNKVGEDPFNAARSRSYTASAHLVIDAPLNGVGFTDAEQEDMVQGLVAFLSDSGNLAKILGKES